jgi:acetyl esterase/lipase
MRLRNLVESTRPECTLVTLRYRLDPPTKPFPTPIHDTLAGLDWVLDNICAADSVVNSLGSHVIPRLSIYGSFVGASLATMLALTEPRHLHSVNLLNPIVDWVGLEDNGQSETTDGKELQNLRRKLFWQPADYFDPFASPLLFLRSPGRDVPVAPGDTGLGENLVSDELGPITKRRKALHHWPPAGSDVKVKGHWRVPRTRFWVTGDGDGRQDIFRA